MAESPIYNPSTPLADLAQSLRQAQRVVALTGAGVSAESGVPTFRGPGGLWRNHRPEDLATPQAFKRDPRLVWEWYDWRRGLIAKVSPNPGHRALADLEHLVPEFTLITQNVDGLHRLAGSRNVLEIHGSIWEVRCTGCGRVAEDRRVPLPLMPYCEACGALLRPNVVWFGEALDPARLQTAHEALRLAEIMLVAGTSGVVQPAASFALWAKESGARLVEINPDPTPLTPYCDWVFQGKSGEVLPALLAAMKTVPV
ncbi:MAG: NAD-dependent deacylase [Deltaproteobacteria bacterium]|nr:NAD-dependent deacylase [Deltaproteobacteria bacterium]